MSISTETNPNGVVVEKIAVFEEESGKKAWHQMMDFKINNTVYSIQVFGSASNEKQLLKTADIIFNSIK